ncbi:MAG: hypothetical protein U9N56_07915 [Actinomycetota bacterium]|nr:hypothetical protein [Actinomycetota bacterium]
MMRHKRLAIIGVLALIAASCTGGEADDTTTTPEAPATTVAPATTAAPTTTEATVTTTTEEPAHPETDMRSLDAGEAAITVDGDAADWGDVAGLSMTLEPIVDRADDPLEDKDVTIRMAHDSDLLYALFTVEDDYDWVADDHNLSAALAVMFPVDTGGPHMGADDEAGETSTGMVDIWHWELDCAAGELNGGGAGHPAGEGKDPGNDDVCNMDDEWATDAETREDDNTATGENSLTGVWWHSNPVENGAPGTWYFEMSRPLDTGDEQDGLFTVGESTLLALAYWDADFGPDGWDDSTHVQSSNQGWINVNLIAGSAAEATRSLDAGEAAITVDGDAADWGDVAGLSMTLEPIVDRADDPLEDKDVTIRMAHDSDLLYALFTVEDDYDWVADDHNLSAALAVMFPVDTGGPHMGADDEAGETSTGMVDIWHWELDCAAGELNGGGAGHPAGEGKDPGNDDVCNMDDEWATDAETREDDNTATGENSLTGVWWHSNPVENGAPGTWYFEMSRPLDTGDEQDGLFTVGESTLLALAYWDADFGPDGWDDSTHVQSSNQGWIEVTIN